jgi:hypothetical protein
MSSPSMACVYSKHPFHLNERLILVLLSSLSFGATYASKELVVQAFLPRWPRSLRPLSDLITNRLLAVPSLLSIALPVVHTVVFSFVYWLVRRSVWRFVLSWFGILTRSALRSLVRVPFHPLTGCPCSSDRTSPTLFELHGSP